jgi:hypothetical protein
MSSHGFMTCPRFLLATLLVANRFQALRLVGRLVVVVAVSIVGQLVVAVVPAVASIGVQAVVAAVVSIAVAAVVVVGALAVALAVPPDAVSALLYAFET